MKCIQSIIAIFMVVMITGCAHPILVSPDIAKIEPDTNSLRIEKNVGYYISSDNRELAVTTPGGGGDKVTYHPYKDIETTFYKMLSNVFKDVTVLKTPTDGDTVKQRMVSYVFTPVITTNSSSSSAFTWPPTQFTLNLTCNVSDGTGKILTSKSVSGEGQAEFNEFKSDHSLSAKRAAQDALLKMQTILLTSPELRN